MEFIAALGAVRAGMGAPDLAGLAEIVARNCFEACAWFAGSASAQTMRCCRQSDATSTVAEEWK